MPAFLRTMPVGELVCACSLLAFGAFVALYGLRYPIFANGVVGPGLMPITTGATLAAGAAVLVWRALRSGRRASGEPAGPNAADATAAEPADGDLTLGDFAEDDGEAAGKPTTVIGILAMLVLAVLLAPIFGLIPMLGLLVFVCMLVFERQGLPTAVAMTAGTTVVSWLLFDWLFGVPLPSGSLWQSLGWW